MHSDHRSTNQIVGLTGLTIIENVYQLKKLSQVEEQFDIESLQELSSALSDRLILLAENPTTALAGL